MVTTASGEKKDRGRAWQRATTRAAILAAARRLLERSGESRFTLTAVAREADFAPTTVFAYFANKDDLFLSMLADDLANFARTMREYGGEQESRVAGDVAATAAAPVPKSSPKPESTDDSRTNVRLRLVEAALPGPTAEEHAAPASAEAAKPDSLATPAPESAPPQEEDDVPLRVALDALAEQVGQQQEAVSKLELRPVDQWLERRLREFERSLAALQTEPEKPDAGFAQTMVSEMRALIARVEAVESRQTGAADDFSRSLRERSEQIERRLREKLSDIEAVHARERARIDALENAAFAASPEFFQKIAPAAPKAPEPAPVAEPVARETAPTLVKEAGTTVEPVGPAEPTASSDAVAPSEPAAPESVSFLTAARRSAQAAAEQSKSNAHSSGRVVRFSRRTLTMIAGGLGLAVLLIWTGVYFETRTVASPSSQAAAHARATVHATTLKRTVHSAAPANAINARAELASALKLLDATPPNDGEAVRLLFGAAQRGDALAAFKLATLYKAGRGVAADPVQAFRWFQFAASKGNCKAMQSLAVAYAEGWGTAKDMSESARWFTRAAGLGLTDAEFNLGVLYERGLGVPQSLTDAYKWYLVAAAQGDRESRARVEALKSQLASTDLAAAEEAAASFRPAPLDADANNAPSAPQTPAG